jgi:hypothetical protein
LCKGNRESANTRQREDLTKHAAIRIPFLCRSVLLRFPSFCTGLQWRQLRRERFSTCRCQYGLQQELCLLPLPPPPPPAPSSHR